MVYTSSDFRKMRMIEQNQRRSLNIKIRRNLVIFTTIFTFIFISSFMITTYAGASNNDLLNYTVEAGDTLWVIAGKHISDHADIREYIFQIKKINNMNDSLIYPGQELMIPIYN